MSQEFIDASNQIFKALQSGAIKEDKAIELQKEIYRRFNRTPGQQFQEASDAVFQEMQSKSAADPSKAAEYQQGAEQIQKELGDYYAPKVSDQAHPEIDSWDRFSLMDLADTPEEKMGYIQKKKPNMVSRMDPQGNVLVKSKGEYGEWNPIDPPGYDSGDFADVAWTLPAAIAEGAASAAGAMSTSFFGGGLPGAIIAGGAAGGGLESLRQGVGMAAGAKDNFDAVQALIATGGGMVGPMITGSGVTLKEIQKHVAKQGLKGDAADAATNKLLKMQRGLLGRGKDALALKLGSSATDFDPGVLSYVRRSLDKLKETKSTGNKGADAIEAFHEKTRFKMKEALHDSGEKLPGLASDPSIKVNVAVIEEPLRRLKAQYEDRAMRMIEQAGDSAEAKIELQNLQEITDTLDKYLIGDHVEYLQGADVGDYLRKINELTDIHKSKDVAIGDMVRKDLRTFSRQSADLLDKQVIDSGPAGKAFKEQKTVHSNLMRLRDNLIDKEFKDPEATERALMSLTSKSQATRQKKIREGLGQIGVKVDEEPIEIVANRQFLDPPSHQVSSSGTTSTSKTLNNPIAHLGAVTGYIAGHKLGDSESEGGIGKYAAGMGGMYLGRKAGQIASTPKALMSYMKGDKNVLSLWDSMNRMGVSKETQRFMTPNIPSAANIWKQQLIRERDQ